MTLQLDDNVLQLAKAIASVVKPETKATGAHIGPTMHGPGGLLSALGLEQPIFSTHLNIVESLAQVLPAMGTVYTEPIAPYITGFVRSDQQEKDGICDDPEEAGNFKTCTLTTRFGRKEFKTRELNITQVGELRNRGEFDDLQLVNSPLVTNLGGIFSGNFGMGNSEALTAGKEMAMRILEKGVAYQRWLCPQVYTGNPSNSSAGKGYEEFMGLDLLIGTGKIDALTGQTCPSLDSLVTDYNYNDVQDSSAPYNIVHVLTQMIHFLQKKASMQLFGNVDFRFVMRSDLFYHITQVWPCEYMTYRCQYSAQSGNSNASQSINDMAAVNLRDDMYNNKYLLIDGRKYPVITDDCIVEETTTDNASVPNGSYSSDIYIVPMTVLNGSKSVFYWEYFDWSKGTIPSVLAARASTFFWADGGRFLWGLKPPVNWCIDMISVIRPRLRLRTPQLAARLTNVVYTPLIHLPEPLPSQPYWVDGGNATGYPAPSPYSEFNPSGPGGQ